MIGHDEQARVGILAERAGDDLSGGLGLGGAARQHPVHERQPGSDAVARQTESDAGQEPSQPCGTRAFGVGARRERPQPAGGQRQPVLQGRRVPVTLRDVRLGGQVQMPCQREPHHRVRRVRGEVAPVVQRRPGQQRDAGTVDPQQFGDEFAHPDRMSVQPGGLTRRGRGEPGQFGERGQVALRHQRRDARLVGDRAEEPVHALGLRDGEQCGRRGGQSQNPGIGQVGDDLVEQPAPHLQQVMALVQDDREGARIVQSLHQGGPVGMQARAG